MLRRRLDDRRVRVGLLLGAAVVLATVLPGWWMLLVAAPLAWSIVETFGLPPRRRRAVAPGVGVVPPETHSLTADDRVRAGEHWLAWLAAGLDVARANEARRQALAHVEARARSALAEDPHGERTA